MEQCSVQEYHDCKHQVDEFYNYVGKGIVLRSKIDWYEHGEKSSEYFVNLVRQNLILENS